MMRYTPNIVVLLVFAIILFAACEKKECSNPVPEITFKSFDQFGDGTAQLTLGFIDCDGDIGLTQADTTPPYDKNLFLDYYEKHNGEWEYIYLISQIKDSTGQLVNDTNYLHYRIPSLEKTTPYDLKEGEIILDMPFYFSRKRNADTIKFTVMLKDYALNESNIVETREIIVPK